MGDMADYYIELEQNASGCWPGGGRHRAYRDPWDVTCNKCGARHLKWRPNDSGRWQLYENERVEHNRLKEHVCPQDIPNPEGFEDVD